MPDQAAEGGPSWDRLFQEAAPQAGYFTLEQARGAGYSPPLVEHHIGARRIERVGRGIFRLVHFPPSDDESLVVVWLWSNRLGVFSHETALMLHQLSDALPGTTHLTVPPSWRRRRLRVPVGVAFAYAEVPASDRAWVDHVPVTTPVRTLVDCAAASADPRLLAQAIRQTEQRGLASRDELHAAFSAANLRLPKTERR